MELTKIIGRQAPNDQTERKSTQISRRVWNLKKICVSIAVKNLGIYTEKAFTCLPSELREEIFNFLISDSRNKINYDIMYMAIPKETTFLDLSFCAGVASKEVVEAILNKCPNIRQLYLHCCTGLTKENFTLFTQAYGSCLTALDITNCFKLSDSEYHLISKMDQLEHLSIRGALVDKNELSNICSLKNLISFNGRTRRDDWTEEHILQLSGNTKLKYLELSNCSKLNETTAKELAKSCNQLEVALLNSCSNFGDTAMAAFCASCTNLQALDISQIGAITADGISQLQLCTNLRFLSLQYNKAVLLDQGIIALASHCKNLEVLDLEFASITDKSVEAIGNHLHLLQVLNLAGTELTGQFLHLIAENCPDLIKLSLRGNFKITDENLSKFLESLPISHDPSFGPPFATLNLTDLNKISDMTLAKIAKKCPNLDSLTLRGCIKLTDQVFTYLCSELGNLRTVDVRETHISAKVVESVRTMRTLLSIYTTFPAASSVSKGNFD